MKDSTVTTKLLLKINGCLAKPGKGSLDAELNLPLVIGIQSTLIVAIHG